MSRPSREDRERERRRRDRQRERRRGDDASHPSSGAASGAAASGAALSSIMNGIVIHPIRGLIATATTILTELTTSTNVPTLAVVSAAAFFIGRWSARSGKRRKGTDVDTIEELLKQPYMRDVGSPATSNGSVGGMFGNVRRAVCGKSQREKDDERIAAIDAQMKSETMSTELAMMGSGFGATSPDVRALIDSVDTRMMLLNTELSIERSGAGFNTSVNDDDGFGGDSTPTSKLAESALTTTDVSAPPDY